MIEVVFGNDVGNGYTKYKGGRFASKVKVGSLLSFGSVNSRKEVHAVKYKNGEYIIGDGESFTGSGRYFTKEYKMALLTSIVLASNSVDKVINAKLVVGLPVNHHKKLGEKVAEEIRSWDVEEISVDGKDYSVEIEEVNVFVEGAYPVLEGIDDKVITIDIGAGTVNVIAWEGQAIVDKYTFDKAFIKLCKEISGYLNENYNISVSSADAEQYIGAKTVETEDGEVAVPQLDEIVETFVSGCASMIEGSFDTKSCKGIYVFGGGGKGTIEHWKKRFKKAKLVKDCQFVNQKVYQAVAESIYLDEE